MFLQQQRRAELLSLFDSKALEERDRQFMLHVQPEDVMAIKKNALMKALVKKKKEVGNQEASIFLFKKRRLVLNSLSNGSAIQKKHRKMLAFLMAMQLRTPRLKGKIPTNTIPHPFVNTSHSLLCELETVASCLAPFGQFIVVVYCRIEIRFFGMLKDIGHISLTRSLSSNALTKLPD